MFGRKRPKAKEKRRRNERKRGFSREAVVAAQHELNMLWIRNQALETEMVEAAFRLEKERDKRPRMYVV